MKALQLLLMGKKTYLVAASLVGSAAYQFLMGEASVQEAVNAVLSGLGLATLRAGVKKGAE